MKNKPAMEIQTLSPLLFNANMNGIIEFVKKLDKGYRTDDLLSGNEDPLQEPLHPC